MSIDEYDFYYNFHPMFGFALYAKEPEGQWFYEIVTSKNTNPEERDITHNLFINKKRAITLRSAKLMTPCSKEFAKTLGFMLWNFHQSLDVFTIDQIKIKE